MTIQKLAHAKDYRSFLKEAFLLEEHESGSFSYASFARRAGFVSRSFPRDVMLGKKRLTAASALSCAEGLKLKGDLKQLFLLLVETEGDGVATNSKLLSKAKKQLEQVRARLLQKAGGHPKKELKLFARSKFWFDVYAALGTASEGASQKDVEQKAGLSAVTIQKTLQELVQAEVCIFNADTGRYYPNDSHIIMDKLGNEDGFKTIFLDSVKQIEKRAHQNFNSKTDLFFNSAFSIQNSKMDQFRTELRELILQFVDQTENPNGDTVAKLVVGFTHNQTMSPS